MSNYLCLCDFFCWICAHSSPSRDLLPCTCGILLLLCDYAALSYCMCIRNPRDVLFFTVNTQITTSPDAPKSDWRVGLQGFMEKEAFRLLCEVKRRLYKACFSAAWCSQKGHFLRRRLTDNVDVCRAVGVAGCSFTHCGK